MFCSSLVLFCFFFFLALTARPVDASASATAGGMFSLEPQIIHITAAGSTSDNTIQYINKSESFQTYVYSRVELTEVKQIVVLGVGTSMSFGDYSSLANNILNHIPNIIVSVLDPNSGWFVKTDPDKFANAVNGIFDWLKAKFNVKAEGLQWYIGGHSASGMAAALAQYNTETSAPKSEKFYPQIRIQGYIGLDPVSNEDISRNPGLQVRIPSLMWGKQFTDLCVSGSAYTNSGVGFYANARSPATSSTGVVHHLLSFNDSKSGHCIYSNSGCVWPLTCFDKKVAPTAWNNVGDSIRRFLQGESIVAYANSLHKQCVSKKDAPCA
eukprot:gene7713-8522_t